MAVACVSQSSSFSQFRVLRSACDSSHTVDGAFLTRPGKPSPDQCTRKGDFFQSSIDAFVLDFQYSGTISALNPCIKDSQIVEVGGVYPTTRQNRRGWVLKYVQQLQLDLSVLFWYLWCSQTAMMIRDLTAGEVVEIR